MSDSPDAAAATPAAPKPLAWMLLLLVAAELLFLYSDITEIGWTAKGLVAVLPLMAFRALRLREGYLLGLCALLLAITWFLGKPLAGVVVEGLSRSSYLASFILLMALLREGAIGSPSVREVGTFLTRQPASRRFVTLFAGGHFFAVLINLGALSLLAPLIHRGVRADLAPGDPLDEIGEVRERRQLSAVLRGFSWFLVWAPTAVTQAVMPTLLDGIQAGRLMATGFVLALFMLGVSWLEDMLRWRRFRRRLKAEGRLPLPSTAKLPARSTRNLGIVCLMLFGSTLGFSFLGDVSVVTGVMLAAPIVIAIWIFAQQSESDGRARATATVGRLREIASGAMPGYSREAVFIACAGFIGTLAANLIPADEVAALIGLADQPGWLVMWVLTALVWIFGQFGLSPITMAVFLGSIVAELPDMPIDMTYAALAIAAGTAVCTSGAPFSSGAVMLARASGRSSVTLTWRWNGLYTVIAMAVLAGVYIALTAV